MNRPNNIRLLRAAALLRRGGLFAHIPSTVPGVAASPFSRSAMVRLQRFKQRRGPFLLLADSRYTAARWARYLPTPLRKAMHDQWPGPVTLIFPGRPGLPAACYQRGRIAIRVDADAGSRFLARHCGGLLASSSLNRRGLAIRQPDRQLRMHWHRHLDAVLPGLQTHSHPSRLLRLEAGRLRRLR